MWYVEGCINIILYGPTSIFNQCCHCKLDSFQKSYINRWRKKHVCNQHNWQSASVISRNIDSSVNRHMIFIGKIMKGVNINTSDKGDTHPCTQPHAHSRKHRTQSHVATYVDIYLLSQACDNHSKAHTAYTRTHMHGARTACVTETARNSSLAHSFMRRHVHTSERQHKQRQTHKHMHMLVHRLVHACVVRAGGA